MRNCGKNLLKPNNSPTLNWAPIDTQSINLRRPRLSCRPVNSSLRLLLPNSSPQLITKVKNLRKEKEGYILLKLPALRKCGKNICKPNFSPNLQLGSNWHTINQSPKDLLLLSTGYLKSWLISTEFIITTVHKSLESTQGKKQWIFSSSCRPWRNCGYNLCKPNIFPNLPQPSIGLQLTHNQIPKASPLLSAANLKSWVISIEFITTSIHKHLESMQENKQWIFSSGCYLYKPNCFPNLQNLQLCSNSQTTKSPKDLAYLYKWFESVIAPSSIDFVTASELTATHQ